MKLDIQPDSWLFCINRFNFPAACAQNDIILDRDFTAQNLCDLIQNSNRYHSDFGIFLNFPSQNTLWSKEQSHSSDTQHALIRNYLNHVISEIHLLGRLIPKTRQVSFMYWQAGFLTYLSTAEWTELMYTLNKSFNLRSHPERRLIAELDSFPQEEADLALLTGLGFTHLGLRYEEKTDQFSEQIKLIRSYGMNVILDMSVILTPLANDKQADTLRTLIRAGANNLCCCDAASASSDIVRQVALEEGMHHVSTNDYSHNITPEYQVNTDIIGMGTHAMTLIDNCICISADQLDQYYQKLECNTLPLQYAGYIKTL